MESEGQPLILNSCHGKADARSESVALELKSTAQAGLKSTSICGSLKSCAFCETNSTDARAKAQVTRRLLFAVGFCLIFMVVEIVGGLMSNSLAILSDAAHMLSDVASFGVSLFAVWASGWRPTYRLSYGFHRLEILGALLSILIIWLVTGLLVYNAMYRLVHEIQPIDGKLMFSVAAVGFFANLVMVFILGHNHHHDHGTEHCSSKCSNTTFFTSEPPKQACLDIEKESQAHIPDKTDIHQRIGIGNLNLRGAYLHTLGDLIQSTGVLIGGGIIWINPKLKLVDVVCTLIFSVVVLCTTLRLLRDVVEMLMEASPPQVDPQALEIGVQGIPGVVGVHELHVWSLTTGKVVLSCHVTVGFDADSDTILEQVITYCHSEHGINHVTVQVERDSSRQLEVP